MVSGPGNVSFTNQFGRNTNASFSTAGTYVLKITAEDETSLAFKNIFYSVEDYITITTGGGGTTQQNQTINFPAITNKILLKFPLYTTVIRVRVPSIKIPVFFAQRRP